MWRGGHLMQLTDGARAFREARDLLQRQRTDYDAALRDFDWPRPAAFNWALEHMDAVGADPATADRPALWIVEEGGAEAKFSFADMRVRSNRLGNWLRESGVGRGDRIILMLANQVELWDAILAAMKLGAIIIPATPMLGPADLRDRIDRGQVTTRGSLWGPRSPTAGSISPTRRVLRTISRRTP